jgi:hypothetical protein
MDDSEVLFVVYVVLCFSTLRGFTGTPVSLLRGSYIAGYFSSGSVVLKSLCFVLCSPFEHWTSRDCFVNCAGHVCKCIPVHQGLN